MTEESPNSSKNSTALTTIPEKDVENAETAVINDRHIQSEPGAAHSKASNKLLWLLLFVQFLLIAGLAGAGYYFYTTVNTVFADSDAAVKAQQGRDKTTQVLITSLQDDIVKVEDQVTQISSSALTQMNEELEKTLKRFNGFENSVDKINKRLSDLSPRDEQQWMISQIEYFLKMAEYRMNLTGDHQGAALLLDQASAVASQLRTPDAQALVKAISQDRATIKIEGYWQPELIHAQIGALIDTIPKLSVASYSKDSFKDKAEPTEISSEGINKILSKLVRVQTTDSTVKPLLDQTTRKQVEQHVFMLLTEAQLNVMRQNQTGFTSALSQLEQLINEAFDADQKETQFFIDEIQRLQKVEITKPTVTLDSSQQALRNLIRIFEQKQNS